MSRFVLREVFMSESASASASACRKARLMPSTGNGIDKFRTRRQSAAVSPRVHSRQNKIPSHRFRARLSSASQYTSLAETLGKKTTNASRRPQFRIFAKAPTTPTSFAETGVTYNCAFFSPMDFDAIRPRRASQKCCRNAKTPTLGDFLDSSPVQSRTSETQFRPRQ